jgi:hypothetical protein
VSDLQAGETRPTRELIADFDTRVVSGTGLCWINNVGNVTLALLSEGNPDYDLIEVAKYQAVQVGVISVWNCLGRVTMGACLDLPSRWVSSSHINARLFGLQKD